MEKTVAIGSIGMATGPLPIVPGVPHTARRPIRCAAVEGESHTSRPDDEC